MPSNWQPLFPEGVTGFVCNDKSFRKAKDIECLILDEWAEMKKHPVYGAMYLSKLPDMPPLTIIAAFEHHLRFDGRGYPETRRLRRKQHIVSQMVAIADVFDALSTERPYRKALDVLATSRLLKERAGIEFNPALVDSFLSSVEQVTGKFQYCQENN